MPSWKELETEFKALHDSLLYARVDGQLGAAGEYWRMAGTFDKNSEKRFLALASIAGQKLADVLTPREENVDEVLKEKDPISRWYKGIWKISDNFKLGHILEQKTSTGDSAGFIHTGTIDDIAETSSVLCLELLARYPEDQEAIGEMRESQARVNRGFSARLSDSLSVKLSFLGISFDLKKFFGNTSD